MMPPTSHSITSEKPDGRSLTWKPRLVNTPMPIMSATASAVAVTSVTEAAGEAAAPSRPGAAPSELCIFMGSWGTLRDPLAAH